MVKKINIIGAGISGLFLGCCLKKNNFSVTIYEQDRDVSEYGAGINLSKNATILLEKTGLLENLIPLGYKPKRVNFRSFNNGRIINSFLLNKEKDDVFLSVNRKDLIELLKNTYLNMGGELIFGKKFNEINNSTEFFSDDERKSELFVACDGIRSEFRQKYFLNDEPKFSNLIAWRGIVSKKNLSNHSLWNEINIHLGPDGHIVHYPISKGEEINFVAIKKQKKWEKESWISEGNKIELLSDFNSWNDTVMELFSKSYKTHKWGLFERESIKKLVSNNLILMGDAAHPVLPFLAQGACLAIEDAYCLAELLSKNDDLIYCLKKYEKLRLKRGKTIQFRSKLQGSFNHLSNGFLVFFRNLILKIFAKDIQKSIHKYNVMDEIKRLPN